MIRKALVAAAVGLGLFLGTANSARAEETESGQKLVWRKQYPKFRPAEIALTSGAMLQVFAALFLYTDPRRNWDGGILFDDAARDLLRFDSRGARVPAAFISDMMYYALLAYPIFDTPIAAAIHGDKEVALQTFAINFESYAVGGAIALSGEKVGRTRPLIDHCETTGGRYDPRCDDKVRLNTSFVSGHTTIAFVGAGLTCAHHLNLPLYGGGAPDIAACIAATVIAATSGTLRVMSDNHWMTDVILGAVAGYGAGYVLPWLLHYRRNVTDAPVRSVLPTFKVGGAGFVVAPNIAPNHYGVTMAGMVF